MLLLFIHGLLSFKQLVKEEQRNDLRIYVKRHLLESRVENGIVALKTNNEKKNHLDEKQKNRKNCFE